MPRQNSILELGLGIPKDSTVRIASILEDREGTTCPSPLGVEFPSSPALRGLGDERGSFPHASKKQGTQGDVPGGRFRKRGRGGSDFCK